MKFLFSEEKRESYLKYYGKKSSTFLFTRLLIVAMILIVGVFAYVMLKSPIILAFIPVIGFIGYKLPYYQLANSKQYDDMLKSFIFPQFLTYFLALINTQGNMYQTIREAGNHLDGEFKNRLMEFVDKVEIDNDFNEYMAFADYVGTNEASMVMSMLYDFSEYGVVKEELEELERMIDKLNSNKTEQMVRVKSDQQEKYMNPPILIIIGFVMIFAVVIVVVNLMQMQKYMQF